MIPRDRRFAGLAVALAGIFLLGAADCVSAQSSGSTERPRLPIPFDPVPEAGSVERFEPPFPLPRDPFPQEAGSIEKPNGRPPLEPPLPEPGSIKTPSTPSGPANRPAETPPPEDRGTPPLITAARSDLIIPVLLLVAGLFLAGWALFRMGMFNPYAETLWPKRLELCMEIALRMDDFMTARQEGKFDKCQMALDALNHLNGRRSILLSNEINLAVNKFVEQAVDVKISQEDEAFQAEFSRQYERVIEALRVATRQEELSLEVLRSLTKAQGPHRKLRDPSSESK